jgi:hypothetical protein
MLNPVTQNSSSAGAGAQRGTYSLWSDAAPAIPGLSLDTLFNSRANSNGKEFVDPKTFKALLEKNSQTKITDAVNKNKKSTQRFTQADVKMPQLFASKIRFPIRNRYVWDESSDARMADSVIDLVLNSLMMVHAQDIHGSDFLVPMNPDMRPGHVIELHNTGYFNGDLLRIEGVVHMFASGGVQNGCVTMGVGVSTQASLDPRKVGETIKKVLALQNDSLRLPVIPMGSDEADTLRPDMLKANNPITWPSFTPQKMYFMQVFHNAFNYVNYLTKFLLDVEPYKKLNEPELSIFKKAKDSILADVEALKTFFSDSGFPLLCKTFAFQHLAWNPDATSVSLSGHAGFSEGDGIDIHLAAMYFKDKCNEVVDIATRIESLLKNLSSLQLLNKGEATLQLIQSPEIKEYKTTFTDDRYLSYINGGIQLPAYENSIYPLVNEIFALNVLKKLSTSNTQKFFTLDNLITDSAYIEDFTNNVDTMAARYTYKLSPRQYVLSPVEIRKSINTPMSAGDVFVDPFIDPGKSFNSNNIKDPETVLGELNSGMYSRNDHKANPNWTIEDDSEEYLITTVVGKNQLQLLSWFKLQYSYLNEIEDKINGYNGTKTYGDSLLKVASIKQLVKAEIDRQFQALTAVLQRVEASGGTHVAPVKGTR